MMRNHAWLCLVLLGTFQSANAGIVEEIRFKPGASSAIINGVVEHGGSDQYTLSANAGQLMSVDLAIKSGDAGIEVVTDFPGQSQPRYLAGTGTGIRILSWQGLLPASKKKRRGNQFRISVIGHAKSDYAISVGITGPGQKGPGGLCRARVRYDFADITMAHICTEHFSTSCYESRHDICNVSYHDRGASDRQPWMSIHKYSLVRLLKQSGIGGGGAIPHKETEFSIDGDLRGVIVNDVIRIHDPEVGVVHGDKRVLYVGDDRLSLHFDLGEYMESEQVAEMAMLFRIRHGARR